MIHISWKAYIEDEEVEKRLETAVDIVVDALVEHNLKEIIIKDPSGVTITVHHFPGGSDIVVDRLYE